MELVVSLGVLSALCMLIAQWFAVAAAQQAREQEQRLAVQTAQNLMEQLYAQPWDALTQDNSAPLAAREVEAHADYQCEAEITDAAADDSGLKAKRIFVRVSHRARRFPAVELMAWRHAREEGP